MFKILDLFCGAGGFSNGLEQVDGFTCVLGVDFNKHALETFKHNHKNAKALFCDISQDENKKQIISLAKELCVNTIIGGPPCQGFSLQGKRLGLNDPRNYLFKDFLEVVKEVNPKLVIIENVKALVSTSSGYFLNEIINTLKNLGYYSEYRVLNAKDFGIPQSRERLFIVATKGFDFTFFKLYQNTKNVNIEEAISDLSFLNSNEGCFEQDRLYEPKSEYQKLLANCEKLYNHQPAKHTEKSIYKMSLIKQNQNGLEILPSELKTKTKFAGAWCRLSNNDISGTIDTRFDAPSGGRYIHPTLNRTITPREAARIQSFSDNFIFLGKQTEVRKQIGNAVPPLLAKAIAQSIMEQINE